jgi:hypothetical protein
MPVEHNGNIQNRELLGYRVKIDQQTATVLEVKQCVWPVLKCGPISKLELGLGPGLLIE